MHVVVGVFALQSQAYQAATRICELIGGSRVYLVAPGAPPEKIHALPTTEDMAPVGNYLAMALGAALGLGLGAVLFLVILDLPVVPAVAGTLVLGGLGALLLGLAGRGVDANVFQGLPADELYVYKDALRQGRSIVFVHVAHADRTDQIKELLRSSGAEAVDPARKDVSVGLGSAEDLDYQPEHGHGPHLEAPNVQGFRP
jgi:hypothetical protein